MKDAWGAVQQKNPHKLSPAAIAVLTKDCFARVDPLFVSHDFSPSAFFLRFLKGQRKTATIIDYVG